MRYRDRLSIVCVILLVALAAGAAQADLTGWQSYIWYVDGTSDWMKVDEYVYDVTQTQSRLTEEGLWDDAYTGSILFSYNVFNASWYTSVTEWGYDIPGGTDFTYVRSPDGWTPGAPSGMSVGWHVSDPNDTDAPFDLGEGTDFFWLVTPNPGHSVYQATAVTPGTTDVATGPVSGPTPEPVTMALLAVGLPLGLLARRRRKED